MVKEVPGYEGLYWIDTEGNVFNRCGRLRKTSKNWSGYIRVTLCKNGLTRTFAVHRLVASAFLIPPGLEYEVNHIDRDRANNKVSNLEWVTHQQNVIHSFTENDKRIAKIAVFTLDGKYIGSFGSIASAARAYNIKQPQISNCVCGLCKSAGGYVWRYADK